MDAWTRYGQPPSTSPDRFRLRVTRREARDAVATTALLAAFGISLGALWSKVSPRVQVVVTAAGPDLAHYDSDEFFAGDGTFVLLGAVAGLLAALALWWLGRRWRGPVQILVLALGCAACAVVVWQVGRRIGLDHFHDLLRSAEPGRRFSKPVDLRGKIGLVAQPFVAVATYMALASWVARPDLGVRRDSVGVYADREVGPGDWHGPQPPEHGHLPAQQP